MRFWFISLLAWGVVGAPSLLSSQERDTIKLTDAEKKILDLTNAARKEYGVAPLLVNATLLKCARQHSLNMAKQDKMAHTLDDKSPFDRLREAGYDFRRAGENIAHGDAIISVREIFQGWLESEGHRKNILSSDFTEIGLGIGVSGEQKYYTQVFGRRFK